MATLQDINGVQHLYEAWPKIEANEQAINVEVVAHKNADTIVHPAEKISYIGNSPGANVKEGIDNLKTRVEAIITTPAEGVTAQEIIDARKGEATLRAKVDSVDSQLADNVTQLALKADKTYTDTQLALKANTTYVDTLTSSIVNGSPKGIYATLTALQTAFPTGNTNIYVVTVDGKWYYWNGTAWTAGGVYQSSLNQELIDARGADISLNERLNRIDMFVYNQLYKLGNEYISKTGGWVQGYASPTSTIATITKNVGDITLYDENHGGAGDLSLIPQNMINLTGVDKIYIDWATQSPNPVATRNNVTLSKLQSADRLTGSVLQINGIFTRQVTEIDVSAYEGEYYIGIHAGDNSSEGYTTQKIYGIYLATGMQGILDKINEGTVDIPIYWETEAATSITTIETLQRVAGINGTSFGFITDTHWGDNNNMSPALLDKVMNDCNIKYYFDGGDVIIGTGLASKASIIQAIIDERNAFKSLYGRCLRVEGNHDPAYSASGELPYYADNLTLGEFFDIFFRASTIGVDIVWGEDGTYFYADDNSLKIRYIGLNAVDTPYEVNKMELFCFRDTQLEWLANKALNVPDSSWSVVLCSHFAPYGSATIINKDIAIGIVSAFKNKTSYNGIGSDATYPVSVTVDYTGKGGEVICWIGGHGHVDAMETVSGINIVTTLNDSKNVVSGQPVKTTGTATEQAFDIFTINKATRTVNITRVGAGVDRSFTY